MKALYALKKVHPIPASYNYFADLKSKRLTFSFIVLSARLLLQSLLMAFGIAPIE